MIKTYTPAVKYLESFIPTPDKKHPGSLGLKRMKLLMNSLGNPQLAYPTIHVGGTSGKGSTATIIASILSTKFKVGLHTSPHLVRINERIITMKQCNNVTMKREIPDKEFVKLLNEILPAINKVEESILGKPSYFEIVTAMAFLYFKLEIVDMAVIEVGMGGMFDATNVIQPIVAVLTNVGLDHTEILGDTVEKIAIDKAGIIKPGMEVVSGVRQRSVIDIVERKENKNNLSLLDRDFRYEIKSTDEEGSVFDYFGEKAYRDLEISLLGEYQVENAAIAIRAIEEFNNETMKQCNNEKIFEKDIKKALSAVFIPGRLEIIQINPTVILDGAHNPDKMKALVTAIKTIYPKRKVISIVAIKEDKNAKEMLKQLLKISEKMIFTRFKLKGDVGVISSYDPNRLSKLAYRITRQHWYISRYTFVVNNIKQSLKEAVKSAEPDDIILVTGSLYLVGEVRKFSIHNELTM